MSNENPNNASNEISDCLKKLCAKICTNKETSKTAYRMTVSMMAAAHSNRKQSSEDFVCRKIQERLMRISSTQQVDKFAEYYQQLKNSHMLKNRASILEFLYSLGPNEPQELESQFRGIQRELSKMNHLVSPSVDKWMFDDSHPRQIQGPPTVSLDSAFGNSYNTTMSTVPSTIKTSFPNNVALDYKNRGTEDCVISEREMIQDVLYAAQGVRRSDSHQGRSCRGKAGLVARLSELGFLHDKICYYIDPSSGYMPIGLIGEGLISAFRNELTEYYRSLAILQSQLNASPSGQGGTLTLKRLLVWSLEPMHRLKWLAIIGHASQNKKGGELASCVHKFLAHGDPRVTSLVYQLLTTVCYPLYVMLCRWLLDGEIDDPHNEFFIDCRSSVAIERLWHDKYRVRESMLPAFISKEQAQHILATGKSVTFLREVCGDREQVGERETLKRVLDNSSIELLFSGGSETKLHAVMSSAYLGVSRRLLDTLLNPHKLLKHLQALRGYLLLGQGDFIQMLMMLLEPELNRNANQLFVHNLTGILDSAVRATNAQFEDQDIINRLYVNLFPPSPQDNGWDVFSLFYRVDGPLGTVLDPEASACYRTLFTHLWRAKRMEHTLSQMWKHHTIEYKRFSKMSEVMPLLRRLHALRSEMIHLVKELQYALFVVVECAWQNFLTSLSRAVALDQLLEAHRQFLASVTAGALLDDSTKQLQSYLGNVYDEILSLHQFETSLYAKISEESERRRNIERLKEERSKKGEYGITKEEEQKNDKNHKMFLQYLNEKKADFNVLSRAYRGHVKTFILKLVLQNEVSLQSLLFRLDYNDFYKRGDSKLHEPLTYQHKRLSEIGLGLAAKQNGNIKKNELLNMEKGKEHTDEQLRKHK